MVPKRREARLRSCELQRGEGGPLGIQTFKVNQHKGILARPVDDRRGTRVAGHFLETVHKNAEI